MFNPELVPWLIMAFVVLLAVMGRDLWLTIFSVIVALFVAANAPAFSVVIPDVLDAAHGYSLRMFDSPFLGQKVILLFAIAFAVGIIRILLWCYQLDERRREETWARWQSWAEEFDHENGNYQYNFTGNDTEYDYYSVLGVKPGATTQEVKAAYRRLAKIHHPDAGGDPETFKKIHAAYRNLLQSVGG